MLLHYCGCLRAIPLKVMEKFRNLPGEHYEFEMNMLMEAAKSHIPIKEVTIQTVYIDQNRASHFNPFLDSLRIYKQIVKFGFSSIGCSIIDISLFTLLFRMFTASQFTHPLFGATVISRLISSGINFSLNKKVVFKSKEGVLPQAVKYYMLCCVQMLCSWLILEELTQLGLSQVVLLKMLTDTFLFFISYGIQRLFVFKGGEAV